MSSRKRTSNIVLISVFAAALAGLGVSLASAATTGHAIRATWTIHPGGSASAAAGKISLQDTRTASTITCSSSVGSGTLRSGSGLPGTGIGSAASASFNNCDGPDGIIIETRITIVPLPINAVSYNSVTGTTTGNISGIHMTGTSTACSFVVDGTGATANNGSVTGTYVNSTGVGSATGGNLHFYNVSGCAGLFSNGDPAKVSGSYKASPVQIVTSP